MTAASIASVFSALDRELWLVTARHGSERGGLIATCVSQASIVPELPRVLVGLAKQHFTCKLVEASGAFALHLLAEQHLSWVWRFGLQSGRDGDKLRDIPYSEKESGSPILTEAAAWLDCRVEARLDGGDRTFYLAEILDGATTATLPALTFSRMLQLAPEQTRLALKEALARDGQIDAKAIQEWRSRSGPEF